jgi:hypothetical protein
MALIEYFSEVYLVIRVYPQQDDMLANTQQEKQNTNKQLLVEFHL